MACSHDINETHFHMDTSFFDKAASYFPDKCFERAVDLGILLGSGWGEALEMDEIVFRAPYADIPGLGASTVRGHAGEFVMYRRGGRLVAAWCGRRHYYEGVGWEPVVLPIEMLRRMGCGTVLLTNASGGINPALRPGDFVIIRDHINLINANPLVGPHRSEWGERFPDMTEIYTRRLAELLHAGANRLGLRVMDGTLQRRARLRDSRRDTSVQGAGRGCRRDVYRSRGRVREGLRDEGRGPLARLESRGGNRPPSARPRRGNRRRRSREAGDAHSRGGLH